MPQLLAAMREHAVTHALCIGVDLPAWPGVLAIAQSHANLYATAGVHPDYVDTPEPSVAQLVEMAQADKVVAIGETGLDYYRLRRRPRLAARRASARTSAPRGKPAGRWSSTRAAAAADTLAIMREERADEVGGVMHCFTETWDVAQAAIDLGFHISFSGIVTFKNAVELKDVARRVPLDRMLIETDSPYLAPVPYRGKRNQPAWVRYVGEAVAQLREVPVEAIARATTDNFFNLFRIARDAPAPAL